MNEFTYKKALKYDKRNYCQFYFSLLKTKYILIFTFYTSNDYNSKIIKIFLFLFSFVSYLTINTLFFYDSTMHKIYVENGKYNFIYQIPNILYSTMIASILNIIVSTLSLTERRILEFKKMKTNINKEMLNLIKFIKIKLALFFFLSFIVLFFFWFYVSCFCVVYINTQMHLIKDTLISFGLSMIYPLGIYLIPGIFRIPSLKAKKNDKECLYQMSKMIQFI